MLNNLKSKYRVVKKKKIGISNAFAIIQVGLIIGFLLCVFLTSFIDSRNVRLRGKIIYGELTSIRGNTKCVKYNYLNKDYNICFSTNRTDGLYVNGKIKLKIDSLKPQNIKFIPWFKIEK